MVYQYLEEFIDGSEFRIKFDIVRTFFKKIEYNS